jgi:hypothetical protein
MSKLIFLTPTDFADAEVAIVISKISAVAVVNGKTIVFVEGTKEPVSVREDFAEVTEKLKSLIK